MSDKPILFSGPMVRALLDGRKSQTRRLIKPPRGWGDRYPHYCPGVLDNGLWFWDGEHDRVGCSAPMPYAVGDRLWVREQHALVPATAYRASEGVQQTVNPTDTYEAAIYREGWDRSGSQRWRPSIHMPRWASRLTLTVTDVRVQRLQEISEEDARAEGVEGHANRKGELGTAKGVFRQLWGDLHGEDAPGCWSANPFVVAVSFSAAHRNIDTPTPAAEESRRGG